MTNLDLRKPKRISTLFSTGSGFWNLRNTIHVALLMLLFSACSINRKHDKFIEANKELIRKSIHAPLSNEDSVKMTLAMTYDTFSVAVDLRPFQTPVKSQDSRNTCAYFAYCAMLESYYKRVHGKDYNLSEEYLAGLYQREFYGAHEFCSIYAPDGAFYESRIITEDRWPYQPSWFEHGFPYFPYRNMAAVPNKALKSYEAPIKLRQTPLDSDIQLVNVNSLLRAIGTLSRDSMPFIATLILTEDRYEHCDSFNGKPFKTTLGESRNINMKTGEFTYEVPNRYRVVGKDTLLLRKMDPEDCYYHFVLVTGYDREKKMLFFKNSWDTSFGDAGYGFIRFAEFMKNGGYFDKLPKNVRLPLPEEPAYAKLRARADSVKVDLAINKIGALDIRMQGAVTGIGKHCLVVRHTLFQLPDSNLGVIDYSKAAACVLGATDSAQLGDEYLRCTWHTPFYGEGGDLRWTEKRPLTQTLGPDGLQTLLKQHGRQRLVLRSSIMVFDDVKGHQVLQRIWTPLPGGLTGEE